MRQRAALWTALVLGGAARLVTACVVPNVELVDHLPTPSHGGSSQGGTDNTSAGTYEPAGGEGGDGVGGGSSGSRGSSGSGGGGASSGTGGMTSGGGSTTSGTCEDPNGYYCADFETFKSSSYLSLSKEQLKPLPAGDPRSGTVALSGYQAVAFAPNASFVNEDGVFSFWVRFPTIADQPFISFGRTDAPLIWFGVEHSRYKWWTDTNPSVVAPSDESLAFAAAVDIWVCVEVERFSKPKPTLSARLTLLDGTQLPLPLVDDVATAGEDDALVNAGAATNDWNGVIKLGVVGTSIEIDDFMFAPASVESTCAAYVKSMPAK